MKRRIKALVMAFVMLFTTVLVSVNDMQVAKADEMATFDVVVHYLRSDGNYTDWNAWMWSGSDGSQYDFTGTDSNGAATLTYTATINQSKIGFIIRKGEWLEKDFDGDQFIDVSEIVGGTADVYITSGKSGYEMNTDNAQLGPKILSASATDNKTVSVELSQEKDLADGLFTVLDANGNALELSNVTKDAKIYTVSLASEIDLTQIYYIVFDGVKYTVSMPDVYSTDEFESKYTYDGDDLGSTWSKDSTTFKVWAPTAEGVSVKLYKSGTAGTDDEISTTAMTQEDKGVWSVNIPGDLNGVYYTYVVDFSSYQKETIDPYAQACGVNGDRGMVIDLDSTDPEGWADDKNPNAGMNYTDAVLYELHVRDFSYDTSSGIKNVGKYLAFTETGTKNSAGQSTGIDYLKDLGITHVHIMPAYDYATVDEASTADQFNWGYDPKNFNIPEGSYSTDAYNGAVRVNEYKQMVQSLHNNGISVVMDVVYNHVSSSSTFSFNLTVPGYFSRPGASGSGCGNDTATERSMVRKYIVDSILYWAKEYHIDGFRFDISGLIDVETMQAIEKEVHAYDSSIILYNEGWTVSTIPTKEGLSFANQGSASQLPGYAFFSDSIRDAIKGSVMNTTDRGFVTGNIFSAIGVCAAAQGDNLWATAPTQIVNYASCHDNETLFDRIQMLCPDDSFAQKVKRNNLSAAIIYTSQGIPFMQAGEELLRTKIKEDGTIDRNSYASSSKENCIKWDDLSKTEYKATYEYYKGLIAFRKAHSALRMTNYADIAKYMSVINDGDNEEGLVEYQISGDANGEVSDGIVVIFNGGDKAQDVTLPDGNWNVCVNAEKAGTDVLATATGSVSVDSMSCMVLVKGATSTSTESTTAASAETTTSSDTSVKTGDSNSSMMFAFLITASIMAVGAGLVLGKKRQTNK